MQRNKQVAMGRKKFNMDPKKVSERVPPVSSGSTMGSLPRSEPGAVRHGFLPFCRAHDPSSHPQPRLLSWGSPDPLCPLVLPVCAEHRHPIYLCPFPLFWRFPGQVSSASLSLLGDPVLNRERPAEEHL